MRIHTKGDCREILVRSENDQCVAFAAAYIRSRSAWRAYHRARTRANVGISHDGRSHKRRVCPVFRCARISLVWMPESVSRADSERKRVIGPWARVSKPAPRFSISRVESKTRVFSLINDEDHRQIPSGLLDGVCGRSKGYLR